jgi:hypothetical protein
MKTATRRGESLTKLAGTYGAVMSKSVLGRLDVALATVSDCRRARSHGFATWTRSPPQLATISSHADHQSTCQHSVFTKAGTGGRYARRSP